jgi:hypothetical protein
MKRKFGTDIPHAVVLLLLVGSSSSCTDTFIGKHEEDPWEGVGTVVSTPCLGSQVSFVGMGWSLGIWDEFVLLYVDSLICLSIYLLTRMQY